MRLKRFDAAKYMATADEQKRALVAAYSTGEPRTIDAALAAVLRARASQEAK
jgi:DNA-binding phage protein